MPDYDFGSLSPYDFQTLSRDLLQAEIGVRFEGFAHGPDGGIDLRNLDNDIVVQCKHYLRSTYDTLLRILRQSERAKVETLRPARYILTTSHGLTVHRKAEIRDIFHPYCRSDDDVFGREELNNLLGLHPRLEEQNFKLWLTSSAVLQRIIRAGAIEDTERAVAHMRARTRRYVQNPSFRHALDILEQSHYCIIAGIPGIGKTTLAEMLLVHYVDRHAFTPIRIGYDFAEAMDSSRWDDKQVFYFDDFLGRTTLDKLRKNEDQRLVEFLADVAQNPRWRFILTTREYILNRAKLRYETLSNANLEFETCVLDLKDYSIEVRAAILYNHIYFSELPLAFKLELLQTHAYRRIALHENYSPRIVEHMTEIRNLALVQADSYVERFIGALDNPTRIWEHAFEEQLSEASQQLLLVLASCPKEVLLTDVEIAYASFARLRRERRGWQPSLRDFERALKELDGNFITTSRVGDDLLVSFHNPSVEDFLRQYLGGHYDDVRDLLDSAVFFEQCVEVARGVRGARSDAAVQNANSLELAMKRLLNADTCRIIRWGNGNQTYGVQHWPVPSTERAAAVVEISELIESEPLRAFSQELIRQMKAHLEKRDIDREAYASLARTLVEKTKLTNDDREYVAAVKRVVLEYASKLDDFRAVVYLRDAKDDLFTPEQIANTASRFVNFCNSEVQRAIYEDDADELHSIAYSLKHFAMALGVVDETRSAVRRIELEAEERSRNDDDDDPEPERDWSEDDASPRFNIDDMFEGLLHDISTVEGLR